MKYSYNWLKELSATKFTPEEMVEEITMHGFEVEETENVGGGLQGVVVGEILEIAKHPGADRLQVTKVNVGKEKLQIVCGAHNISVGDKVPVALVGTVLPGNFAIKEAEIRGVKSFGMLCAQDELGLGTDHSGILLLDRATKVGTPLAEVIGEKDTIMDIKVLPDRAHDAVSHVGMAREIAALGGTEIDYDYDDLELPRQKTKKISVKIGKAQLCKRYAAAVLENVTVAPSPRWLKARLENCGIRSINNVVDVTNYVMLELGQPLHAFDAAKIAGDITVRGAKDGEEMEVLDGSVKKLESGDIVIASGGKAVALAGVMGGSDSGVSQNTTSVVLEAATFHPVSIRRTRTRLNMPTDAALRFEKDLDPNIAGKALLRAIELLEHVAGAELEGIVDEYPDKLKSWTLKLDGGYVESLLGKEISAKEIKRILASLGLGVAEKKNIFTVTVPTFRLDVRTPEDLIEEIGRIHGYDKIEAEAPLVRVAAAPANEKRVFARKMKSILVSQGFSEVYNYSFYGKHDAGLAELGTVKHLELENPGTPEQALTRVSLIPGILKNIQLNLKNFKNISIFETGRVFWPDSGVLPVEKNMLVGALVLEEAGNKNQAKRQAPTFFAAKGYCDDLLAQLGITDHYYDNFDPDGFEMPQTFWHQGRSAQIKLAGSEKSVGFLGEVNPLILANFDIHTRVALFEFDLENLRALAKTENEFQPLRKYPVVRRDISLLAQAGVLVDEILQVIQRAGGDLVLDVDLFDLFDFADGTTSFAFHLTFGADERTLTSAEVDEALGRAVAALEKDLAVKLRK